MTQTNMHEAKSQLSRLIQKATAGEDVVIARDGKPVARLVALREPGSKRELGQWSGSFRMADDFDRTPPGFESYGSP